MFLKNYIGVFRSKFRVENNFLSMELRPSLNHQLISVNGIGNRLLAELKN